VALPILYSFRRCPYAIRARLALLQAGQRVALREVDLKHKPAAMLAIAPAATVPVLDLGGGTVLTESLDIMRWALEQHDPDNWLVRGNSEHLQRLLNATDGAFKQALDRYKYAERHPQRPPGAYRDEAVQALIGPLEATLATTLFLGGPKPCWVDAAVFPFVRQFAAVDASWWLSSPWAATRQWLDGWLASTLFVDCMRARRPAWQPGDPVEHFPDGPSRI
jgi:glutathione S-transferase